MATNWRWVDRPGFAGPHGGAARPVLMGRVGAVSSGHALASLAGLDVLREGGNAFDAAVAAAAVVTVAEPYMSGIGGMGGAVYYHSPSDHCGALDFHGYTPATAVHTMWSKQEDLLDGLSGAVVPGVVAGWAALAERYGTMKFSRLLSPAIEAAREGVPVSVVCSYFIGVSADRLSRDPAASSVFLPGGRPLQAGEMLVQKQLARTLSTIAEQGPRAFYEGAIASSIVKGCAESDGLLSSNDLAAATAEWKQTVSCRYRDHQVHSTPLPLSSFQVLETLRILEGMNIVDKGFLSADHLHTLIEAIKLAGTDRAKHEQDADLDLNLLFAEEYVARRRACIDKDRAGWFCGERYNPDAPPEAVAADDPRKHNTTHLVAVDAKGNMVSMTQTLGWLFGGGVMVGDTGMFLNDLAFWFDLDQRSPNAMAPAKKMSLPIAPSLLFDPVGRPRMAVGTPGGHGILQTTVQMISNALDFNLNPQAALEAPRLRVNQGRAVYIESRVPESVRSELGRRGHELDVMGEWAYKVNSLGRGHMAVYDHDSAVVSLGSDPRGDPYGLAF